MTAALLLLAACTGKPDVPDDTSTPDTGDTATDPRTACVDGAWSEVPLADGSVSLATDHYDLTVDAAADPQDFGRMVEAAWQAWSADLGAAPTGHLELVLYPTQDAWLAGLAERGISSPGDAGGYYDPGTGFASLWRQPTLYMTEMLFLHEAFHQFHLQARTGAATLPTWYTEGLAEWTSRHDWDGRCIHVGADPRATWEDYWAQAASRVDDSDLHAWVSLDAFPDRPAMMSFVHFMDEEQTDVWRAFREAEDFGAGTTLEPAGLDGAWAAHVTAHQEPLAPVWLDCLHQTPNTMRLLSPGGITAVRWKEPPSHLEAEVPVVAGGSSGGLVGLSDDGFDVLFVDETGGVSRWTYTSDRNDWFGIGSIPTPGATVSWVQDGTSVRIDDVAFDLDPILPLAVGHAIYGGTGDFVTVGETP